MASAKQPITFSYERLVDRLMAKRRWEEARRWCHQGIEAVASIYPGIETAMHKQLQTINWRSGNPLAWVGPSGRGVFCRALSSRFSGFVQSRSQGARRPRRRGLGAALSGKLADDPVLVENARAIPKVAWPLPPPEVEVPNIEAIEAPMTGILTQLAIAEKQPDEVLKWYDYAGRKKGGLGLSDFLGRCHRGG